jgi:hypothetical protein
MPGKKNTNKALQKLPPDAGRLLSPARPIAGLGSTHRATLRYCDFISLNASVGAWTQQVYSASGLYDPDVTGTGHQPMGFDQLMAFYDHYLVERARIRVVPTSGSTTHVNPSIQCILVTDNGTFCSATANYPNEIMESNRRKSALQLDCGLGNPPRCKPISASVDVAKFFGRRFRNNRDFMGDASSNPTDQVYFEIANLAISNGDPGAITSTVEIEFDVVFTEPRALSQS